MGAILDQHHKQPQFRPVRSLAGLHDAVLYVLAPVVALSPLTMVEGPFGGLVPAFMLAGLAIVYWTALIAMDSQPALALRQFGGLTALWIGLVGFMLLQALPIGSISGPFGFTSADGGRLWSDTLALVPLASWPAMAHWIGAGLLFFLVVQIGGRTDRALLICRAGFGLCVGIAAIDLGLAMLIGQEAADASRIAPGLPTVGVVLGAALAIEHLARHSRAQDAMPTILSIGLAVLFATLLVRRDGPDLVAALVASGTILALGAMATRQRVARVAAPLGLAGLVLGTALALTSPATDRQASLDALWSIIRQRPLLGYGTGGLDGAVGLLHLPEMDAVPAFLMAWIELGLFVGSIPILLVLAVALRAFQLLLWHRASLLPALATIGAVIVLFFAAQGDFSLAAQPNAYLLVTILGLGFASGRRVD